MFPVASKYVRVSLIVRPYGGVCDNQRFRSKLADIELDHVVLVRLPLTSCPSVLGSGVLVPVARELPVRKLEAAARDLAHLLRHDIAMDATV